MGERHLQTKVDVLRRVYEGDFAVGAPQIAYRERLGQRAEIDCTHKKQTGATSSAMARPVRR